METVTPYGIDPAHLSDTACLGDDVYVTWDGRCLHLRDIEAAPPGEWITLDPHMIHALFLFCESRRIP